MQQLRCVFFFLFFTSQLSHITIWSCFSPLFSRPDEPQFSRAISNTERQPRFPLAAVFLRVRDYGAALHTDLAISLRVLQFSLTTPGMFCARITVSVEVSFFSLFLHPTETNPFIIKAFGNVFFLPLFFTMPGANESEKQQRLSRCCFFYFSNRILHNCL